MTTLAIAQAAALYAERPLPHAEIEAAIGPADAAELRARAEAIGWTATRPWEETARDLLEHWRERTARES